MKKVIFYYFFLLSLFLILSSGVIDSQDGFQYLAVARNIYYTGKPTAPVYEYDKEKNIHMSTYVGKDGNTYSPTGLGYSLALLPAVAISDFVYKIYHVSPSIHFPLENDWLIFLTASFTNGFFASLLGVILFLYLIELGLSKREALFISFIGLFTTNLLVYAKHSFPHMMFTAFLVLSFFLLRKYAITKKQFFLVFCGVSYGITATIYNPTFLLSVIPFILYYILLLKPKLKAVDIKIALKDTLLFLLGMAPFILIFIWFEITRAGVTVAEDRSSPAFFASYATTLVQRLPITILFEGIYGQLFSPGRSIFIYSPMLLIILLFWHKIRNAVKPELFVFILLASIYILFYAAQYSDGGAERGLAALWHGESSWGPRYLTPLIPFGLLITGLIFTKLRRYQKRFIFFPLVAIGFYVQILGVMMPYQIKFHDLEPKFFLNSTEFTNFTYSNLLPRYSPIIMMSRKLIKLISNLPKTFDHGEYNVRFYDGVDFPFNVGSERWRVIAGKGYIFFDNLPNDSIKKISLGLINHPVREASDSAVLQFTLNGRQLSNDKTILKLRERKMVELDLKSEQIKDRDNLLIINVDFQMPFKEKEFVLPFNRNLSLLKTSPQILGMISFSINERQISLESLDFPYVSALGPAMLGIEYRNYGGEDKDPWKTWQIHTQIYERVPDFWWFKFLYYWDVPKTPIFLLLAFIFSVSIYSGFKTFRNISK